MKQILVVNDCHLLCAIPSFVKRKSEQKVLKLIKCNRFLLAQTSSQTRTKSTYSAVK